MLSIGAVPGRFIRSVGSSFIKLFLLVSYCHILPVHAQDTLKLKKLTLEDVYKLALSNSYQLKATEKNLRDARQRVEISKSDRLPVVSSDLSYGYISNAESWSPSFSNHRTSLIPHHFTAFSVQASQVVFKGSEIENTIRKTSFQEQIASLSYEKDKEDVKLLVSAKYLDIYRLSSQQKNLPK